MKRVYLLMMKKKKLENGLELIKKSFILRVLKKVSLYEMIIKEVIGCKNTTKVKKI